MSEISNLNYTSSSTGRNMRTNYILNTYPEDTKYYHKENIVSKDQGGKHVYHTAEQEYSVSYDDGGSVIKLDTLLDDLKNERNHPTANTISITETRPGHTNTTLLKNANTNVYKTKTYQENISSNYNVNSLPERSPCKTKSYQENISSNYNVNTLPERNPCIDCNESHKFHVHHDDVLQDQYFAGKNLENHHSSSSTKKIISSGSGLSQDIKEIALVDDILPVPGTKVTTTVRTYTYEIPNHVVVKSLPVDQNDNQIYGDRRQNIIESTNIQSKLYSQNTNPPHNGPTVIMPPNDMETDRTFYYKNITSNSRNVVNDGPTVIMPPNDMETDRTFYYKNITSNSRNVVNEHPIDVDVSNTKYEINTKYEVDQNTRPNDKIRLPSNSSNSPILLPSPFPTDEVDRLNKNNNPPKRLDDLMATFEGDKTQRNYHETWRDGTKIEQDTSTASPGKPEARSLSKNMQGPPVFYPPGQEITVRKEEMSGGYRAQGSAAKASGSYEYGAESSSKTKKSSGAAVVPVCLPLCCAMPCTIM